MNSNESHGGHHGASNNRGQNQHRESPFAAFAVLQAVLVCITATTGCSYTGSIKSDLTYTVPAQQRLDDQPQQQHRTEAARKAGRP